MKITISPKDISVQPKKYCRLVVTQDLQSWHRLVETADGQLEYRLGAGKWQDMTPRKFRLFLRSIVQAAKGHQIEHLAIQLSNSPFPQLTELGDEWVVRTLAENLHLAAYEFSKYKTTKKPSKQLKEIIVCGGMSAAEKRSFSAGEIIAMGANTTRDIANTSGADMYPAALAAAAKDAVSGTDVQVRVLTEKQITAAKMGLLTAVGKGAEHPPRFITMEYWGAKKTERPVVLVGKGITYDSGGLNVKPSGAMHDMHLDMSGGAAMIGAMQAIGKLKLKKNVIALIPAAENAISDRSMRAGDILTSLSGKTVEVIHTDAEGRLVLADALTYAQQKYQPKVIIDAATLTGAALVALGKRASAIMTKDRKLQDTLEQLGEESGDLVWPLPLWDEYKETIKSQRADIANIDPSFSKFGGTIEGGSFLSHFVDPKIPWAHIDIAPRMDSIPADKLAKGATGEPVRLLVRFVETY